MIQKEWTDLFLTEGDFRELYEASNGFNDDLNKNHRIRQENTSFASFIDEGTDGLIADHIDLVKKLL